jgi:four helix bundle protein
MFKFEKLEVWRKAVELYKDISQLSDSIDRRDQFSLGDQVRRAALSVSTNIAEGSGRGGEKESKHFFNIAKGSTYEVVSLLYVMKSRGYVAQKTFDVVYDRCDEIARMITGLLDK